MSDTTPTMPEITMRERLARAACYQDGCTCGGPGNCKGWDIYEGEVDAILLEMMEPSEGMKQAAMNVDAVKVLDGMVQTAFVHGIRLPEGEPPLWQAYRAMLQHILDDGKTVRIPMEGKVS